MSRDRRTPDQRALLVPDAVVAEAESLPLPDVGRTVVHWQ